MISKLDQELFMLIHGIKSNFWNKFFIIINVLSYILPFAIGIYLYFTIQTNHFLITVATVMGAWITNSLVKIAIKRDRPYIALPNVNNITEALLPSFPSGHTVVTFSLAILLVLLGLVHLGIAFLIFGFFVGLSRINIGVHYPSDILGGIILGVIFPLLLSNYFPFK